MKTFLLLDVLILLDPIMHYSSVLFTL